MEILYVILGIVLIIAIMAFTGYYLEKKQKNVVESENNINIIFDEVNEYKNVNAATNAEIPDVLNFNEIEEYENKKEQSNVEPIQFDIQNSIDNDNNNDINIIQFDESVKIDDKQVQEDIPAVLDLTDSSISEENVEITEEIQEEPVVLDLNSNEIEGDVSESIEIPEEINEPVQEEVVMENETEEPVAEVNEEIQEEPVVLDLNSSEIEENVSESIEIPEVVNESVQEDVVPVEEPVKKNKKTKSKSKKNAVSDDEVRQDIVVDSDSITIPDDF